MKSKACAECGKRKPIGKFGRDKNKRDGHSYICKACLNAYCKTRYQAKRKAIRKKQEAYYRVHKKEIQRGRKVYRESHKEEERARGKKWYENNRELAIKRARQQVLANPDLNRTRRRLWQRRRRQDPVARILDSLRGRVQSAISQGSKSAKTLELLGTTLETFRDHLKSLFQPDMTWDNYGKWEIDHIKPCVLFDLSKPKEQKRCFNYKNLQPLWSIENRKKGGRIA